jgi:hypothetical protein
MGIIYRKLHDCLNATADKLSAATIGAPRNRAAAPLPSKAKLKNHWFCKHDDIKVLRDLRFSLNQPLKSANDQYIGILKNRVKRWEYFSFCFSVTFNFPFNLTRRRLRDFDMIFTNTVFKINHKLYSLRVRPPPQTNILGAPMQWLTWSPIGIYLYERWMHQQTDWQLGRHCPAISWWH